VGCAMKSESLQAHPVSLVYEHLKEDFLRKGGREKRKLFFELKEQYRKLLLASEKNKHLPSDRQRVKPRHGFAQSKTFQFPDAQRKQPDKLESDMFNIAENSWRASFRRKKLIRDLQGLENPEPLHPEEKHDPSKGLIGNQPRVEGEHRIDLFSKNLNEVPDGILMRNSNIQVLDMRSNDIQALPDKFCTRLLRLVECNLSYNKLTSLPMSLGNLTNLRKLSVGSNRLRGLPASIGHLCRLNTLNIEKNHISTLPCTMCYLSSLQALLLRGNPPFLFPPQEVVDAGLEEIRSTLAVTLDNVKRARSKFWDELRRMHMTVPDVIASLPQTDQQAMVNKRDFISTISAIQLKMSMQETEALWFMADAFGEGKVLTSDLLFVLKIPIQLLNQIPALRRRSGSLASIATDKAED